MAYRICFNCEHWNKPHSWDQNSGFRSCLKIPHKDSVSYWEDEEPYDYKISEEYLAVASDSSGYGASIQTRGNFGCVLFEAIRPDVKENE
jgi:hypothetical protein